MNTYKNLSRRGFLQLSASSAALSGIGLNLGTLSSALAASVQTDYKALVCIFLYGGNDAHNTVLATDSASWGKYLEARQDNSTGEGIALKAPGVAPVPSSDNIPTKLGGVLPITPLTTQTGRTFALHPSLKKSKTLFTNKRLAILPNVGPLFKPLTKTQYNALSNAPSGDIPYQLFSHNDQQSTWMAHSVEGATTGWGGRMLDYLKNSNPNLSPFASINASDNAVYLVGEQVVPYRVSNTGGIAIEAIKDTNTTLFNSTVAKTTAVNLVKAGGTHLLQQDYADIVARSISAEAQLRGALNSVGSAPSAAAYSAYIDPITGESSTTDAAIAAENSLIPQLQIVWRIIKAQASLGMKRQIFFVSLGGFDTHDDQNATHPVLMAKLDYALDYFNTILTNAGLQNKVTTFTASDFGRSLSSNGDGTDHGWGGHYFVMGGAVKGGDFYGSDVNNYPKIGVSKNGFDNPNEVGNRGSMLPTTSVDQYGATLANWMGITSDSELNSLFPHLTNFPKKNLGFMS